MTIERVAIDKGSPVKQGASGPALDFETLETPSREAVILTRGGRI
jgi:hypothetical protein